MEFFNIEMGTELIAAEDRLPRAYTSFGSKSAAKHHLETLQKYGNGNNCELQKLKSGGYAVVRY